MLLVFLVYYIVSFRRRGFNNFRSLKNVILKSPCLSFLHCAPFHPKNPLGFFTVLARLADSFLCSVFIVSRDNLI